MINRDLTQNKINILGTDFCGASLQEAAKLVLSGGEELSGGYICFSNVHTTVMAHDSREYRDILNSSSYTFADGAPIARLMRRMGLKDAERVAGPDFMTEVFKLCDKDPAPGSHFFYGSGEKTLSLLKKQLNEKYPHLKIAGMFSPPFRKVTPSEDAEFMEMIRDSGARYIWVGLGAPKQERWMAAHAGMFEGVMLGVGAGFDFHAGTVGRAPVFMQKAGLEWLYRLFKDPKRLFKRYLVTNTKFILYTKGMRRG
ncbi:MAG: WecB/TagA/CpsF family glycosyltransferase [Lachnospiraceae bacterium]|nr:WecB/TagA/CpsF family glycosyltransferase [Lachnospiraceae bacterium]